jgi:hypothetical protein
MSANQLNERPAEDGKVSTDLATRMRTTLTVGALVAATCITGLASLANWHHESSEDSASIRAWGDLERQRIELKLEHSVAIAESIADTLAAAQITTDPQPLTLARNLLDNRRIGLEGATLTILDAHGITLADSTGMQRDLREHPAVLGMMSTRRMAAEADRDVSGRETAVMLALPLFARDDRRLVGGFVVRLPLASLLAGGSLNAGNAALVSREHLMTRGSAFAASSVFPLHLDSPLDRLGLRLEMATRPHPGTWSPALVAAIWFVSGMLLALALVSAARWTSAFILAAKGSRASSRPEVDSASPPQAVILQFQGQPRDVINA